MTTLLTRRDPQGMTWGNFWVLAVVIAMVATLAAIGGTATPAPTMVELLGDEDLTRPVMLTDLRNKVTGTLQRENGGDRTGVDLALIDSGVAPVAGRCGLSW